MRNFLLERNRWLVALVALALLFSLSPGALLREAAAQTPPSDGLVCTNGASPNPTFSLTTRQGYIGTPDGNVVYMWGFSEGNRPFQHPSPALCVNEGDTVTIILHNTLTTDVSIIFPGQENVLANGAIAQPQFDDNGELVSLTNVAEANGGSVTYSFLASRPGTFLYQSGTDPARQVRLGLFGALIVRPALGPDYVYNRADSRFNPDFEFMVLLSEIDPYLNQAAERGEPFDMANYHPRYWMVNGRGFPDTVAPNFASWLPSQPYGALARIYPYDPVNNPLPAVSRYLNVAGQDLPFHPHGNNGLIIGRDGFPMEGPTGEDLSFERFTFNMSPGQTLDSLFRWYDPEDYSEANPVPVTVPNLQNLVYGMFYSGSPYLGMMGPMPVGMTTQNQCGEYYIIAHNHALFQITSWGTPMTGQATYLRVDPPLPNECP